MKQLMDDIIQKYELIPESKLVLYYIPHDSELITCWFDSDTIRQKRQLELEDFNLITKY